MARNADNMCGIASDCVYPIIKAARRIRQPRDRFGVVMVARLGAGDSGAGHEISMGE